MALKTVAVIQIVSLGDTRLWRDVSFRAAPRREWKLERYGG